METDIDTIDFPPNRLGQGLVLAMLVAEKSKAQMIILEILEHTGDADLEDWLTAAFIEHQHDLPLKELRAVVESGTGGTPVSFV